MDIYSLHWHDHPLYTKEWYDNECNDLDPDVVAVELDLSYDRSVKAVVFKAFKEAHILRGKYEVNPHLPVIRTLDYGKTCSCVFSQIDAFGKITFFHEIVLHEEETPTDKLGTAVQRFSETCGASVFRDHDDPAGKHDNYVNKEEVSWKVVQRYGILPYHTISGSLANRRENRVELIKTKLSEFPGGAPLVRVHESMTTTIEAFRTGYRYKQDPKTKEILDEIVEQHPHEDVIDCVGITMVEEFNVKALISKVKRRRSTGKRDPYTGRRIG